MGGIASCCGVRERLQESPCQSAEQEQPKLPQLKAESELEKEAGQVQPQLTQEQLPYCGHPLDHPFEPPQYVYVYQPFRILPKTHAVHP